jgi:translocation and assembly module TamA
MPTLQSLHARSSRALALIALGLTLLAGNARADVTVDVRGEGLTDSMRTNVLAYLSFERYKTSDTLTNDVIERLQERVEREVRGALRPFGYYEPTVKSQVKSERSNDKTSWQVGIDVNLGKPVLIGKVNVNVTGDGAEYSRIREVLATNEIRPGDTLNHSSYESLKGGLLRAAATYGFFDARMKKSEMRVDPAAYVADIEIAFETGSRYRFGATTIKQDVIDEALVRRYLRYRQDEMFDATELLRTQFALDDSQYFATVTVLPEERNTEDLIVPITIDAEPNRRNRYSYGVGYGTDTEIRGTVAWDDRRVNTRGHRFRTEIKAAEQQQTLDARYIVPIGDPALEKFTLELTGEHQEFSGIDNRIIDLLPSVTHVRDRWQRVTFAILEHQRAEFTEAQVTDNQTLVIPGISFSLLPSNYLGEVLFTRALYAELRGSHSALGSDSNFLQIRVEAERVFDFGVGEDKKWHVILRGELGASAVAQAGQLAVSQRFFAGGDRSVRGFGYKSLSPVQEVVDPNGKAQLQKVGGKHLFAGSVELVRDLPWQNLSLAAFTDVGGAFDRFGDPLEQSVGLGIRLRLPIVTVGIDVAQALTTPPGATERPGPKLHLNFSPKL